MECTICKGILSQIALAHAIDHKGGKAHATCVDMEPSNARIVVPTNAGESLVAWLAEMLRVPPIEVDGIPETHDQWINSRARNIAMVLMSRGWVDPEITEPMRPATRKEPTT